MIVRVAALFAVCVVAWCVLAVLVAVAYRLVVVIWP